jgi:poly-gamma-glutamate capsule biosynthesis protein CapA/YwtB (metallophosphatase superfamily)
MKRRDCIAHCGHGGAARLAASAAPTHGGVAGSEDREPRGPVTPGTGGVTLFVCGDVMTGRGIDQVLPHPVPPRLYEAYVQSAGEYAELAEHAHGGIPRPAGFAYVWGDALAEWARRRPVARIANLETAVTTSEDAWPAKGIHYRMSPRNVACLTAAQLDCCVLANNHVLDWGRAGLAETLATLRAAGIATAGAGADAAEAARPAILKLPGRGRVLVFAYGACSSGVPPDWSATASRAGINILTGLSAQHVAAIASEVHAHKCSGDLVVMSLHWGDNWGYHISPEEQAFARGVSWSSVHRCARSARRLGSAAGTTRYRARSWSLITSVEISLSGATKAS